MERIVLDIMVVNKNLFYGSSLSFFDERIFIVYFLTLIF
jgi:hypothetical protein